MDQTSRIRLGKARQAKGQTSDDDELRLARIGLLHGPRDPKIHSIPPSSGTDGVRGVGAPDWRETQTGDCAVCPEMKMPSADHELLSVSALPCRWKRVTGLVTQSPRMARVLR